MDADNRQLREELIKLRSRVEALETLENEYQILKMKFAEVLQERNELRSLSAFLQRELQRYHGGDPGSGESTGRGVEQNNVEQNNV